MAEKIPKRVSWCRSRLANFDGVYEQNFDWDFPRYARWMCQKGRLVSRLGNDGNTFLAFQRRYYCHKFGILR